LDFIAELNRGIDKYDLEFRKAANEDTGEICWALVSRNSLFTCRLVILIVIYDQVNTDGDKIAQYATGYSSQELQYFKKIVSINRIDCIIVFNPL
jgi:hypothetical protein